MKLTNNIVEKYGSDKIMHCAIFGWIVALFGIINFYAGLGAFAVMFVLSVYKEKKLDDFFDKNDLLFGTLGGLLSLLICFIKFLI